MTTAGGLPKRQRARLALARADIPTLIAYVALAGLTGIGATREELSRLWQLRRHPRRADPTIEPQR